MNDKLEILKLKLIQSILYECLWPSSEIFEFLTAYKICIIKKFRLYFDKAKNEYGDLWKENLRSVAEANNKIEIYNCCANNIKSVSNFSKNTNQDKNEVLLNQMTYIIKECKNEDALFEDLVIMAVGQSISGSTWAKIGQIDRKILESICTDFSISGEYWYQRDELGSGDGSGDGYLKISIPSKRYLKLEIKFNQDGNPEGVDVTQGRDAELLITWKIKEEKLINLEKRGIKVIELSDFEWPIKFAKCLEKWGIPYKVGRLLCGARKKREEKFVW